MLNVCLAIQIQAVA